MKKTCSAYMVDKYAHNSKDLLNKCDVDIIIPYSVSSQENFVEQLIIYDIHYLPKRKPSFFHFTDFQV